MGSTALVPRNILTWGARIPVGKAACVESSWLGGEVGKEAGLCKDFSSKWGKVFGFILGIVGKLRSLKGVPSGLYS